MEGSNNNETLDDGNDDIRMEADKDEPEMTSDKSDDDYEIQKKKSRQPDTVTLSFSRKALAKETAITAKRHKIGVAAQRDLITNVINVGGGEELTQNVKNNLLNKFLDSSQTSRFVYNGVL